MSTVKEVIERYNVKVPFPISPAKIEAAGYDVEQYTDDLIREIVEADDSDSPHVQEFLTAIETVGLEDELT